MIKICIAAAVNVMSNGVLVTFFWGGGGNSPYILTHLNNGGLGAGNEHMFKGGLILYIGGLIFTKQNYFRVLHNDHDN